MKKYPVITISREYGSGGHEVASLLAEKLGLPLYDNELIIEAAKDSGYAESAFEDAEESFSSFWGLRFNTMSEYGIYELPLQDKLYLIQSMTIKKIAKRGPAVIVGRCADHVLKEVVPTVNIFVHSDTEHRVKRIMERTGLNYEKAEAKIKKMDKCRASYYKMNTDQKWGDRKNYDLIINSAWGTEKTATLLAAFIEAYED